MGAAPAARAALFPGAPGGSPRASGVTLLSAPALERALAQYPLGLPATQTFALRGVYALDPAYDESHVFVGLEEAQRLFRLPGRVSGVDLRLADLDDAGAVRRELERRLGLAEGRPARYRIRTWYDLQASLYGVMRLEKWAATAILALIVVVAAFNIVGALTMIVIEKQRDLAALQAMGATPGDVRRVFLLEGLLVGGVGTALGLAAGLGLALAQARYGLVKLAGAEAFVIEAYPVAIRPLDVLGIAALAVGLCALASLYPAGRAAAVAPADALRSAG
jgi:lipoprotein-releasing system permease protein